MSIDVGFRSERGPILMSIMVSTALIAIDSTIIAAAVPTIVEDLGGFAQFPWLFSVYLLAQAVTVPVYAKLADVVGRKPIMLFGIGLFLLGSILCGLAGSMPALIAFRALQGLGAGAIQPMSMTIAGDIYTVVERAKVQGYLASMWAMGAVLGPTLGGIFAQLDVWRGIFFVNVPICILAGWMILRHLHENVERRRHRVDFAGALLLMASLSLLILAVLEGGQAWAWNSPQSIGAFALGGLLLATFVVVESRAAEPILPLWLFSRRLLLTTTLIALGVGAIPGGLASFTPVYLEGAAGAAPILSSVALFALAGSWPVAAAMSGRLYLRIGFRSTSIIGACGVVAGTALLAGFAHAPSIWLVAIACAITGFGMGWLASPALIAAQASVEWGERGVVSGANVFGRAIGNAVGVAIYGAIANAIFRGQDVAALEPAVVADGIGAVYLAVLAVAVASLVGAFAMPRTPVAGTGGGSPVD